MKVVIVGIDEYSQFFYQFLPENEKAHFLGFANWDLNYVEQIVTILGKPIIDGNEISKNKTDLKLYLALTTNRFLSIAIEKLHDIGITDVYFVPLYCLEKKINPFLEDRSQAEKVCLIDLSKPYLAHLETHVVDYCNLKCKACNNFAPLFAEGETCSAETYSGDIQKIKKKFADVLRIYLVGGEPLLQPELLMQFLNTSRENFAFAEIRVLTNGILLQEMPEKLFQCMIENDICIQMTCYKLVESRIQEIEEFLKNKKVKYIISDVVRRFIKRLTPFPYENAIITESKCGSAGCAFLRDGKLAKCPDAILVDRFDYAFGTCFKSKDDIDLDSDSSGFDMIRKLNRPIDMCKFCTDRIEWIDWEPVGAVIEKRDWLTKDKVEYYLEKCEELQQEYHAIFDMTQNLKRTEKLQERRKRKQRRIKK